MSNFKTELSYNLESECWYFTMTGDKGAANFMIYDGEIFDISFMLLEYEDGIFYGMAQVPLSIGGVRSELHTTLTRTGLVFTPQEIQDILKTQELKKLGEYLNGNQ